MTQSPDRNARYVVGVDVGSGSARAGLFDLSGAMLASARRDISMFREAGAIVEQSSAEIWDAVCAEPVSKAEKVEITGLEQMKLIVNPGRTHSVRD